MADNYNLSVTASTLNTAITKANAAAPQSTTYTKAEVDAALANKANSSDLYGTGTEIPENTDLNDLTTPGKYYSPNATRSATLSNTPYTTTALYMTVETVGANVIQTMWTSSTARAIMYKRVKSTTAWGVWYQFEGTPVTQ